MMKIQTSLSQNKYNIIHVQKDSPVAMILFLTKNGSRYETLGNTGISHFLEHMMFKPTLKRRTSKEINTEIESIGGMTNAFTAHEYTGYYIQVLEEHFDHAFEILSDLIQNGVFAEEDIEIEKGVIIEEINMIEDSPSEKVEELAQSNIFPGNMLGAPIIGNKKSINNFSREQLMLYLQNQYYQNDWVVVSVGAFGIEKTEDLCTRYLSSRQEGTLQFRKATFSPTQKLSFHKKEEVNQAHLVLTFPGVSTLSPDLTKIDVVETVLGGGMGSILFDLLREKLGSVYYIQTTHSDYMDTGVFEISFGSSFDKLRLSVDKIFEVLTKLKNELISLEELQRAQNLLYSHYAMSHENIGYLGQKYGIEYLLKREVEPLEVEKKKIFAITPQDILEAANTLFNDNFNITYIADKEVL